MDIVQARKKAREKAAQETAMDRPEPETKTQATSPAPAAKQAKPVKKVKAPKTPAAKPASRPKPKPTAEALPPPGPKQVPPRAGGALAGAQPPAAPAKDLSPAPTLEDDIFTDMSFGEDLPVPAEEDLAIELGAEPTPAPEKPLPTKPASAPAPAATPSPAPPPSQPEPKPAPAKTPSLPETLAPEKDDFLELVSEDLYRREFGEAGLEEPGEQLELLSFQLAQETYAIRLTLVQQIIKLREITMVPRAPDYILGVISLRGMIIPIFDLRRRLGLAQRAPARENRIIVVGQGTKSIGLIVDRVHQVVRIPATGMEPPPAILAGLESEYLEGIGRSEGRMLIILNLDKVLAPPTVH